MNLYEFRCAANCNTYYVVAMNWSDAWAAASKRWPRLDFNQARRTAGKERVQVA